MKEEERQIEVGIIQAESVNVVLNGDYLCKGITCSGEYCFGADLEDELIFKPSSGKCTFTLKDVTIGIGFHWQRCENQSFKGRLKLFVREGLLFVVNIIGIEDYLTSVISSEMSASASLELLKAHAVISRSWVIRQIERKREGNPMDGMIDTPDEFIRWQENEDHKYFDVCADDHCQRYQGVTKAFTPNVQKAVKETWGEVLMYDGQVCDARFSKCCGGTTEVFDTCWENISVPYLASVEDSFCNVSDYSILKRILPSFDQPTTDFHDWKVCYTFEEISKLVYSKSGVDYGMITDLIPVSRGASGRISRLRIIGTKRTKTIGKELEIRKTLSRSHLLSSAFDIEKTGTGFILRGKGWGHGVGLCQIGAAVMGERGFSYRQILNHYYTDTIIEKLYEYHE